MEYKEKVEKVKYGFRIRPEVNDLIETHKYKHDFDRSAFVSEAIKRYCAEIDGEKSADVLIDKITTNIRAITRNDINRLCKIMFKGAVELSMLNHMLAAGYVGLDDEAVRNIRARVTNTVRKTQGYVSFEEALDFERSAYDD